MSPEKVCAVIVATALLHNLCCDMNDGVGGFTEVPEDIDGGIEIISATEETITLEQEML